jgi:hypothetical protein
MAKQYDLKDLGEVYGNLGKETAVLAEDTQSLTVGDAKAGIGSADILPGGPTKEGGFEEPTVDVTKCGDKNPYNVKAYSYGADNDPGVGAEEPAPTGEDALHGEEDEEGKKPDADGDGVPDWADKKPGKDDHADKKKKEEEEDEDEEAEEDEESSENVSQIAQNGLNNFMSKKSVFDRLYDKVMVNETYGEMEEMDDLDALGLDDATPDAEVDEADGEEEVTITLDKELAQHLCDILKDACGDEEADDEAGDEVEDGDSDVFTDGEEDEEGAPHTFNTHYNDGKSNKVGNMGDGYGQPKVQALNKVHHKPTAGASDKDIAPKPLSHTVNDGKSNKVGNLPAGKNAFGDLKVEPMNKSVKA